MEPFNRLRFLLWKRYRLELASAHGLTDRMCQPEINRHRTTSLNSFSQTNSLTTHQASALSGLQRR